MRHARLSQIPPANFTVETLLLALRLKPRGGKKRMVETKQELSSESFRKDEKLLHEHNPEISLYEPLILI